MEAPFSSKAVGEKGWRQGAVLGPALKLIANRCKPNRIAGTEEEWLVVTSHDCDILNDQLDKEPVVEVIRGVPTSDPEPNHQQAGGRNPRVLQVKAKDSANNAIVLRFSVHERWTLAREHLATEAPSTFVPDPQRRIIAEWLAKRYIRSAFPSAFDERWRAKLNKWTNLLKKHSEYIQGVYIRLNTLIELKEDSKYKVAFIVACPIEARESENWPRTRSEIEKSIEDFWSKFPGIEFDEVSIQGTDAVTLYDIERYQRFDADWVSFADDSPLTPTVIGLHT
jgi:hypothetical protein